MYRNRANQRTMCVKSALILSIPAQKGSGLCPPQHIQVKLWNTRGLPSTFCSAFRGSPSTLCGLLLPAELIYQTLTHTQPLKPSVTHCLFLISSLLSKREPGTSLRKPSLHSTSHMVNSELFQFLTTWWAPVSQAWFQISSFYHHSDKGQRVVKTSINAWLINLNICYHFSMFTY